MIWHNKEDLQLYHPNTDGRCYCELLLSPDDLVLQAILPQVNSGMVFRARVRSAVEPFTILDNIGTIGSSDDIGDIIVAKNSAGGYYATIRMNTYPSDVCSGSLADRCFVVQFEVIQTVDGVTTTIFDKWTQPYCIADCCLTNIVMEVGEGNQKKTFTDANSYEGVYTNCGQPLVRIKSTYECFDADGYYYGTPTQVIYTAGEPITHIPFYQITNIGGLFKPLPAEITVIEARNCKTQKSESSNPWMLQGSDFVPAWKMRDLENQFRASQILINGDEYKFNGGSSFEKIQNYQKDWRAEYFRLDTLFKECRIWNIFGCITQCGLSNTQRLIGVPEGIDVYRVYDDSGMQIATDLTGWEIYLNSIEGVTSVTDLSYIYSSFGYSTVYLVESDSVIPSYFYLNNVGEIYKTYPVQDLPDLNTGCDSAQVGTITFSSADCAPAQIGTVTFSPNNNFVAQVYTSQDWIVQGGGVAVVNDNQVMMTFISRNTNYASNQPVQFELSGDIVGWVGAGAAPSSTRLIQQQGLPTGVSIIVETNGMVRWYGAIDNYVGYGEVVITNIIYNL